MCRVCKDPSLATGAGISYGEGGSNAHRVSSATMAMAKSRRRPRHDDSVGRYTKGTKRRIDSNNNHAVESLRWGGDTYDGQCTLPVAEMQEDDRLASEGTPVCIGRQTGLLYVEQEKGRRAFRRHRRI